MIKIDIVKIAKKNIAIIIPSAIAAAAALLFVPTIMMQGKISSRLEESTRLGSEVDSALRTVVSGKQYEVAREYEDMHQADANEIEKLAQQTSQRELLSYKIFPEPNEKSMQIFNEFKKSCNNAFAKLVNDINALDAPTDTEIRKQAGAIEISAAGVRNEGGQAGTGDERIVELICRRRSEEITVYADPRVFSGYAFWNNWEYAGTEGAVRDCWYSQLAYWIHQDIVNTINTINSGSASVSDSSVKRLLSIRFASGDAADFSKDNGLELPVYVTEKSGGLYMPWTARKCNDQLDVIHFSLAVIVKADDVLKFMAELCSEKQHYFAGYKGDQERKKYKHNQITVLQSSVQPVDRNSPEHKRYYYGQNAVVFLNIICEYVFNRQGYDTIKPKLVQMEIDSSEPGMGGMQQQQQQQQYDMISPGGRR
ncbi:MAG: hypothetical protein WC496_08005 [Phycisphaerae bacterium]|jgi:hypothetical protein